MFPLNDSGLVFMLGGSQSPVLVSFGLKHTTLVTVQDVNVFLGVCVEPYALIVVEFDIFP